MSLGLAKTSPLDLFLVHQFVTRLTKPFVKWKAYNLGVIDETGKVLIKRENRTPEQDESLKMFDMLVLRLKRMLDTIPGGSSRLATWAASWMLVRESVNLEMSDDEILNGLQETIQLISEEDIMVLTEDAPANNVSGGNIAGANKDPVKMKRFGRSDVFVVNSDVFARARFGKGRYHTYERYVGDCNIGQAIREYGRTYPKKPIIIEDEKSGAMLYLKQGSYK